MFARLVPRKSIRYAFAVSDFPQRAERAIGRARLIPPGQRVLAAVSGGVDSMVLLHVLHTLAAKNRWRLAVAHFNHQLRGRASDADEKLVRAAAKKLSLPYVTERGAVADFARHAKISMEMAARKLRHEFLARAARGQKSSVIALAHHAADQVELFFLRLLRGAGGEGLAGMKARSPSPADAGIHLVRPLLDFTKAELREFAREQKIRFREDATNLSNDPLRNRLRNDLLPRLQKQYQPGLAGTVRRTMAIVGAEAEFAGDTARTWLAQTPPASAGKITFAQLPVAVQRHAVQQQLATLQVTPDFELIEQLRLSPGKPVSGGAGLFLMRTAAGRLGWHTPPATGFQAGTLAVKLAGVQGQIDFAGRAIRWQLKPLKKFSRPAPVTGLETFDADRVGPDIVLRHWQAGDRFQPIGLPKAAKLQDLFVNAKIPAARRRELVVATTADGTLFWVEGLRLGEGFKLTPATRRQLVWQWA